MAKSKEPKAAKPPKEPKAGKGKGKGAKDGKAAKGAGKAPKRRRPRMGLVDRLTVLVMVLFLAALAVPGLVG